MAQHVGERLLQGSVERQPGQRRKRRQIGRKLRLDPDLRRTAAPAGDQFVERIHHPQTVEPLRTQLRQPIAHQTERAPGLLADIAGTGHQRLGRRATGILSPGWNPFLKCCLISIL